ncbi:phasin family protein [Salinibacter altiplanensis]|uniref:phasin family protein n=1 Tax=Salinibacter altiplanensis TaxID=1803181 RepID=UPI000C9EDCB5|nr:phasin family protein [Salinibacter altiplanensis]
MTAEHDGSPPDNLQDELTERGREVWLAGLGALATVEEEGTKLFNRLVDRGQDFEEERQARIEEATEKVREQSDEALAQLEEAGEETQSMLADSVKAALDRFGVPTQKEVDDLADTVTRLSEQVEELADHLAEKEEASPDQS